MPTNLLCDAVLAGVVLCCSVLVMCCSVLCDAMRCDAVRWCANAGCRCSGGEDEDGDGWIEDLRLHAAGMITSGACMHPGANNVGVVLCEVSVGAPQGPGCWGSSSGGISYCILDEKEVKVDGTYARACRPTDEHLVLL